MSGQGLMLKGQSLKDTESVKKSFIEAEKLTCIRWERFTFVNNTNDWTVKIVLIQGLDELPSTPPDGYVRDTGVMVGAINVYPNTSQVLEIRNDVYCRATRVKISIKSRPTDGGDEIDQNFDDLVAPSGYFFCSNTVGIEPGRGAKGEASPRERIQYSIKVFNTHPVLAEKAVGVGKK